MAITIGDKKPTTTKSANFRISQGIPTNPPFINQLDDSGLGQISWTITRTGAGKYNLVSASPLYIPASENISVKISAPSDTGTTVLGFVVWTISSITQITLNTYNVSGTLSDGVLSETPMEILVYPA